MSPSVKDLERLSDHMLTVLLSLATAQHQIVESLKGIRADLDDLDKEVAGIKRKILAVTECLDTMDSK